jgi:cytosine/adenosine deaminase-related metal-dependent hydrolase
MLLTMALALPMDGPPIRDAAILVADGRIVAIGGRAEIAALPEARGVEQRNFGDAVALPGLVNGHIHLEFTALGPLNAPESFHPWIRGLVAWSQGQTEDDWRASTIAGARASLASGVTCLGEILTRNYGLATMRDLGLRGTAYLEFLGGRRATLDEELARFDTRLADARTILSDGSDPPAVRLGLSPHTPYSVTGPAIRAVAGRAHAADLPLAMHLAESPDEVAFLRDGTGAIADFLRTAEPDGSPRETYRAGGYGVGPVAHVAAHALFRAGHPTLIIHGTQLTDEEIAELRAVGAAVVLCPRSNELLRCGTAPVGALLASGVTLAIGTDSLGSNEDLDLFNELRALATLARAQGLADEAALARRLLGLATIEGARALALDDQLGSLTPGKLADLAILDLPDALSDDPYRAILAEGGTARVRCTVLGGHVVYESVTV